MGELEKIKARTVVDTATGCWIWQGAVAGNGYGAVRISGRTISAHRAAYALVHGDIPGGLVVRHKCDTPLCCNPEHLIAGTHADNIKDKVSRGRARGNESRGEEHHNAILTERDVIEIVGLVRAGQSRAAVGRQFGVSRRTVSGIASRRSWRHLSI